LSGMPLWRGLYGLLLSPGKSVFLYSPPLAVAVFGLAALARRRPAFAAAFVATFAPVLLLYGRFLNWDGDWAWGPRYLTFALPTLCLPLAVLIDRAHGQAKGRRPLVALLAAAFAAGLAVQVIGGALYWGHWFRIASTMITEWLGKPPCGPPPNPDG